MVFKQTAYDRVCIRNNKYHTLLKLSELISHSIYVEIADFQAVIGINIHESISNFFLQNR